MNGEEKGQKEERMKPSWKARTTKFFERFGLKKEKRMLSVGKALIFALLVFEAGLIVVQLLEDSAANWRIIATSGALLGLLVSEGLTLFVFKKAAFKVALYIASLLCIFGLVATTGSSYVPVLYILALTEFYLSAKKKRVSVLVFTIGVPLYLAAYAVTNVLLHESVPLMTLLTQSFEALVYLTVHFIVVNFLLGFYRQFLRLRKAMKDLDESNARLKEAYDELAEVTALQERQRIAKDIHDTAGHSITTVIMQTEAAKLIIEKDPSSAKQKIVAANLQAKHALEELRESVHLLSGSLGKPTLKTALLEIIAQSTDGTNVTIRHSVDDVTVDDEKYRFLCNTLKEGVSNGLRHGGATAFYFELKEEEDKIEFLLSDNGVGLETEKLEKGFGLSGMSKGAEALGGAIVFYSEPDEGFEIRLTLPVIAQDKVMDGGKKDEN
ncbi:MAG: sensor histidine kinase [Clostridia bacterium]|nr:sensor histidine kinase [Clostridia bacterium]